MELEVEKIKMQKELQEQKHKNKMEELNLEKEIEEIRKNHTFTKNIEINRR